MINWMKQVAAGPSINVFNAFLCLICLLFAAAEGNVSATLGWTVGVIANLQIAGYKCT